ncbi:MAG: RNA polymerase subunit sigma-70 [Acidimicrobiales bacterium]
MTEATLHRARAGDERAFRQLTEPHRPELQVHCYRMLGSIHDAEDMVQETLLAAWRGLERFEERASLRAWLYRIATNRCLNARRDRRRRPRPALADPQFEPPEPTHWAEPLPLDPYPDALLGELADTAPGPEARHDTRETIELAFIAGLQHLPPRQRAVLVLRDVLGFRARDVAAMLHDSEASVKGALQRARANLDDRHPPRDRDRAPPPRSTVERAVAGRFAEAFANDDIEHVVALLTDDARLAMPPCPHSYQGRAAIGDFLAASAAWRGVRRYQLVATRANTQPAFGCYLEDPNPPTSQPAGLIVLTLDADRLSTITRFMDTSVFPHFGLSPTLDVT